ncbi:MAG: tetratricopeptide repeat protein [Acidobacteriia bacterium]|nr:tetratricopeptide repeat protein [Terriglobia bacterium]
MKLPETILAAVLIAFLAGASPAAEQAAAPAFPSPAMAGARQAWDAGQYEKAAQLLQAAAAGDARNGEIYHFLSQCQMELGRYDAAVESAERAVALAPGSSLYHQWLGRAYGEKADRSSWFSALGLAKKTRKEFEMAVQLDDLNISARQNLIEFYCAAPGIVGGGEDKAQAHIARLAALDAAEGHYARGNCRRQKKDFAATDREFTQALESAPKSPERIYDMGDYFFQGKRGTLLEKVAEAGVKAAPGDARAEFYRGAACFLKNEKLEEAERMLRSYLARAPVRSDYPRPAAARLLLGHVCERLGRNADARKEYQGVLRDDAKNQEAQEALRRLGGN